MAKKKMSNSSTKMVESLAEQAKFFSELSMSSLEPQEKTANEAGPPRNLETILNPQEMGSLEKEELEQFLHAHEFSPLRQVKNVECIEPVSEVWENRPKSNIIKWLLDKSGRHFSEIADAYECSDSTFNNKLHRDSFSFDDIVIAAYICGYTVTFTSNNTDAENNKTYQVDVQEYLRVTDSSALMRILTYDKDLKDTKRREYERLKAQMEKLKGEFGFED